VAGIRGVSSEAACEHRCRRQCGRLPLPEAGSTARRDTDSGTSGQAIEPRHPRRPRHHRRYSRLRRSAPAEESPASVSPPGLLPQPSSAAPASRLPRTRESVGREPDAVKSTLDSAADVKPDHGAGAAGPWPSVESRRCAPTVLTDRPNGRTDTAVVLRYGCGTASA
jgi:hypothetical protein